VLLTSLELDDGLAVVGDLHCKHETAPNLRITYLVVDNDLEVQSILVHDLLDGLEVAPYQLARSSPKKSKQTDVVGVKDLTTSATTHTYSFSNSP
jgi:hypothetical protein